MSEPKRTDMEAVVAAIDDLHEQAYCEGWKEADALTLTLGLPVDRPEDVPHRLRDLFQ